MSNKSRAEVTMAMWGSIAFAMFGLFLSGGIADGLTVIHLVIAIVLCAAAFGSTAFIFNWDNPEADSKQIEKVKRDRLDKVLRDLSDEELVALKKRLSTRDVDDEVLYDYLVGDDGELIDHVSR